MSSGQNTLSERRHRFVQSLYGLNHALTQNSSAAALARQKLAKLRRAFAGPRQEAEAYGIVFPFDPPRAEQEVWLLVAGLFALYPQPPTARGRSIGAAMGLLAAERGESARRRLEQLLSIDGQHLPYYLRQAVTLLRSAEIPFDFHRLLSDLLVLLRSEFTADEAHAVRLRWGRDFYRPERTAPGRQATTPSESTEPPESTSPTESADSIGSAESATA
jgi:CRISPR system Cascade subunit CasB